MKWWKVLASIVGAPVVTSASVCIHAAQTGQHCPFTLGSVIVPTIPGIIYGLVNLFTKPPHVP